MDCILVTPRTFAQTVCPLAPRKRKFVSTPEIEPQRSDIASSSESESDTETETVTTVATTTTAVDETTTTETFAQLDEFADGSSLEVNIETITTTVVTVTTKVTKTTTSRSKSEL